MARVYTTPNSRLDDARRLTQDYPAFGENLSRASSRSSNASDTSRLAYPRVPEDILDQIDEARAARDRALANWNAARQDPDVNQVREAELGSKYLEAQQELDRAEHQRRVFYVGRPSELSTGTTPRLAAPTPLRAVSEQLEIRLKQGEDPRNLGHTANAEVQVTDKTSARIERTRAKLSSSHVISPPRPLLPPPLPVPSPSRHPSQPLVQLVPENLAPLLEGEDLKKWVHKTSVYKNKPLKMADNLKFSRTEHDHVELASQDVAVQPRSLSPAILASPLLQIATRFSLQPIPEDLAPFLEQREDPNNWCHRADAKTGLEDRRLQVANECNLARTERDHAKPLDRHAATSRLVFPTLLTPFPQSLGYEDSAPSLWEQGKPTPDLNYRASSKTGEEVELVGEREEGMRSRGQNTLAPNAPMTVVGSELLYQHLHTRAQLLRGEGAREVPPNQLVLNSPPPLGNYAFKLRPSRSPSFLGTTSNRGSSDILSEVLEEKEIPKGAPMGPVNLIMEIEMEVGVDHQIGGMLIRVTRTTMTEDKVMTTNREEVGMGIMNHVVVHVGEDHWEVTLRMMGNRKVADMETPKGVTKKIRRGEEV
ncbi:hypothetical protein K435DRAFT_809103 [Dendrothele bispora CBS 962.96]|uniref:Uncharacterized protein n=1 Tax=Dendrothele bispora (strain CBS 962.96) TaxID=1314807 RepID=A0A4S8KZM7_DENBC|nr:hypothetical protein K435DRAFT_809103 [Dendrothele bispora CBS 962.96]